MNCDEVRARNWSEIERPWDVIVIGGGIVGAGVFREASRLGLQTLLLEAHDFASGTSSRSSKMVHGGFRYLKNAQIKLTMDSVRERKQLLREGRWLDQTAAIYACKLCRRQNPGLGLWPGPGSL